MIKEYHNLIQEYLDKGFDLEAAQYEAQDRMIDKYGDNEADKILSKVPWYDEI